MSKRYSPLTKQVNNVKKFSISFSIIILLMSCQKSTNDWINITPGPNLEGWTRINIPPEAPLSDVQQWFVDPETNAVRCNGKGGHEWLRYDESEFSNFIFHVEWKFEKIDGEPKYNSGVYVRNNADGTIWHQGQTGDGSGGYLFGKSLVNGDPVRSSTKDQMAENPVKPAGEWNTFDITCKGSTLSMVANGTQTVVWEDCEVSQGFVGLEAEGYAVEFRNLRIKKI